MPGAKLQLSPLPSTVDLQILGGNMLGQPDAVLREVENRAGPKPFSQPANEQSAGRGFTAPPRDNPPKSAFSELTRLAASLRLTTRRA
jgi:hypothetical protein